MVVRLVGDSAQHTLLVVELQHTAQSGSGDLPVGDRHGGQRVIHAGAGVGVITLVAVAAVAAALAIGTGGACGAVGALLAVRAGLAVLALETLRALCAGGAFLTVAAGLAVLAVLTVLAVHAFDLQFGHDLAPGLILGQDDRVVHIHGELRQGHLVIAVVDQLCHGVDLHAALGLDVAILGNGHPEIFGGQQMHHLVIGDSDLHIVVHFPHIVVRHMHLQGGGDHHELLVRQLPEILAELHRACGGLCHVCTARVGNAQTCVEIVVVDKVIRQILEVQQDTVAQGHHAVVIEIGKTLFGHRGPACVGTGKKNRPRQSGRVLRSRPEGKPLPLIRISTEDIAGCVEYRRHPGGMPDAKSCKCNTGNDPQCYNQESKSFIHSHLPQSCLFSGYILRAHNGNSAA